MQTASANVLYPLRKFSTSYKEQIVFLINLFFFGLCGGGYIIIFLSIYKVLQDLGFWYIICVIFIMVINKGKNKNGNRVIK